MAAALLIAEGSQSRLQWLTVLSWQSFPVSILVTPVVNRGLLALDVDGVVVFDLVIALVIGITGYLQWFWFLPALVRRLKADSRGYPE